MSKAIEVKDLTKVYHGGVHALNGISFDVEEGEIFGFLGPNGAGKSTTIKVLIGLLNPTGGVLHINGVDIRRHPSETKRATGYAAQETAIDDRLTGQENIALQGHFYRLPRRGIQARSAEILELFDLYDPREDLTETYSGGMLKRLDIAEALIHRPKILFLDEPTLGLDVQTRQVIWGYIERLRKQQGMTIFLTTHYMEEADALCDRVAIIDHREIKALHTPSALKAGLGGDLIRVRIDGPDGNAASVVTSFRSIPQVHEVEGDGNGRYRIIVRQQGDKVIPRAWGSRPSA
jgi:ABC-2 type transport system ATP-binding protein